MIAGLSEGTIRGGRLHLMVNGFSFLSRQFIITSENVLMLPRNSSFMESHFSTLLFSACLPERLSCFGERACTSGTKQASAGAVAICDCGDGGGQSSKFCYSQKPVWTGQKVRFYYHPKTLLPFHLDCHMVWSITLSVCMSVCLSAGADPGGGGS